MAYIATRSETEAAGELKTVYRRWKERLGSVPNIIRAVSLRPEKLVINERIRYAVAYQASSLGKRREELIAILISDRLQCHY